MVHQRPDNVGQTHRSLRSLVYDRLREMIIEGELPQGSRLVERDIADELGVSRIPLREAVSQLQLEGLVEVLPRRGAAVSTLTRKSVEDLFDVRESLEVLAARLAAQRADASDKHKLRQQLERAQRATARRSDHDIAAANSAFHVLIVEIAGNDLLSHLMRPLDGQLRRLFRLTSHRDSQELCREHQGLYDAIVAGDQVRAGKLALAHVASGRAPTLAKLAPPAEQEDLAQ